MKIKWLAHSAFLITAASGTRIVTDPYKFMERHNHSEFAEAADIVTVSHGHGDHNNVAPIKGNPLVLDKVPDARLMVIGNDYGYVKAFARFLARGLPVEFVYGMPRSELYKTYGRAKAFVMPSEIEAIPLVSSEATMAGVPPILSDAGGNPEIVLDGKTGFIVPLDDYALQAERIAQCLTDRELSERLVRQGKEFLSQFTTDKMMSGLEEIYRDVIGRGKLNR